MPRPLLSSLLVIAATLPLFTAPARGEAGGDFAQRANALCRDIIAARDHTVMDGAQRGMLDLVIEAMQGKEPPTPERAAELAALLEASRDELAASLDALRAIAPEDAHTARHVDTLLADARHKIDIREARLDLLARADAPDWQWPLETGLDIPEGPSGAEIEAAWQALGFAQRDCQYLFYSPGLPAGYGPYWAEAAAICATVYERRLTQPFTDWQRAALDALVTVMSGDVPAPDAAEPIGSLAAEWTRTAGDFAAISPETTPVPQAWEALLASMASNAKLYTARAEAIAARDEDGLRAAFIDARPSGFDAASVGMEESSCRALANLS
ncbi:hypothetical protein [Pelagibacterium lacus]|nr:hypothetical protein [Pelagibacterium lacus]